MVSYPVGTDMRLHRRRHRLAVAAERSKRELSQRESNKKFIAETGDGIPTPANQNMCAIVSEEMTGTKSMVARGEQRCGGRRWTEMRRI